MQQEKVSIILPTYNRAHLLGKTLESILGQTYPFFELILVDDGSTDDTRHLVEKFGDRRIRYYNPGINQGAAAARNYGMAQADCDYIAFADSDDIWHRDKLEKQMDVLKRTDITTGFVYHKIAYDLGEGRCAVLPSEELPPEKKSGNIYAQLLYDNLVPCPSILVKRQCLEQAGEFDTELKALEDYDFALKMAAGYQAVFLDEILLEASYSTTGVSGNAINYLLASCRMVQKYRDDYLRTDTLNHRIEVILRDSEAIGMQEQFVSLLERMIKAGN